MLLCDPYLFFDFADLCLPQPAFVPISIPRLEHVELNSLVAGGQPQSPTHFVLAEGVGRPGRRGPCEELHNVRGPRGGIGQEWAQEVCTGAKV